MSNNMKYFLTALGIVTVAALGSVFTALGQDWYAALARPSEWPPDYLFPIVWSAVYILSFFTFFLRIKDGGELKRLYGIGIANGILNVLWCLSFFTLHIPLLGLFVIILNLAAALAFVREIYGTNRMWAYVMSVYPEWVSLATALNLAIWILN